MMAPQKKKPLPGQHRKVEPLTRKMEAVAPPRPQLEVLQERMDQTATAVQMDKLHGEAMGRIDATRAEMHKLHGETMGRMDILQERMKSMATREEMHKLHGEAMGRIDVLQEHMKSMATTAEMYKLHGEAMDRIGKVEGDLTFIKWTLSVFVAPLTIAMAAGIIKLVFFP